LLCPEHFVYHHSVTRLTAVAIALSLSACAQAGDPWYVTESDTTSTDGGGDPTGLDPAVLEIFDSKSCLGCHGATLQRSELDVSSLEGLLVGGIKAGPAIVPCDPDASPLVQVLEGGIDDGTLTVSPMPLVGAALEPDEVAVIRAWITDGAGVEDCVGPLPEIDGDIFKIFQQYTCMTCHDGTDGANVLGGLDMSTLEGLLAGGGKAGPSIVACDPDASPLIQVVEGGIDDGTVSVALMPLTGASLQPADIDALRAWISAGAGIEDCGDIPDDPPDTSLWTESVRPMLETYCAACHGEGGFANPVFLGDESTLDLVVANSYGVCPDLTGADCILAMMEEGHMPQGGGCAGQGGEDGCPTADDIQLVSDWIDAGAVH